jgi:hypothetical protein
MKLELLFILGAVFFVIDTTHDNKYSKQLMSYKKHLKTAGVVFGLFSLYLFIKRNPSESSSMVGHLNGMIRYMPIDKESVDLITPFLKNNMPKTDSRLYTSGLDTSMKTAGGSTVRSVSGTKKKYVAAAQDWKCDGCHNKLDAWFEVDHKRRLADGGSNHIDNLVALCRNCHGKKTLLENL